MSIFVSTTSRPVSGLYISKLINNEFPSLAPRKLNPITTESSASISPIKEYNIEVEYTEEEIDHISSPATADDDDKYTDEPLTDDFSIKRDRFVEIMWEDSYSNVSYGPALVTSMDEFKLTATVIPLEPMKEKDSARVPNYYVQLVNLASPGGRRKLKFVLYSGGEAVTVPLKSITYHTDFDFSNYFSIDTSSDKCFICGEEEDAGCAILACMHRLCYGCASRLPTNKCPYCRQDISGVWCTNITPEKNKKLSNTASNRPEQRHNMMLRNTFP